MSIYYGVVKNNQIVLNEGVQLPDGAHVEIRVSAPPAMSETEFEQTLIEQGWLDAPDSVEPVAKDIDRTPVIVQGKPVSETLLEERR